MKMNLEGAVTLIIRGWMAFRLKWDTDKLQTVELHKRAFSAVEIEEVIKD